jgi:hypothetical protein
MKGRHCRNPIRSRRGGVTNSGYKRYILYKIKVQRNRNMEMITYVPKVTKQKNNKEPNNSYNGRRNQ